MRRSSLSLELALLGFLIQEPKHGYAIHQEVTAATGLGPVWQLKLSLLYAMLSKLEEAGYITPTTEAQENKPPRKMFHLTEAGKQAYASWVQRPVKHGRSLRLEFLVKLYFARREGAAVAANLLADQREQCHSWLVAEQELVTEEETGARQYGRLVHLFRLGQIQAMLDWLNQCAEA